MPVLKEQIVSYPGNENVLPRAGKCDSLAGGGLGRGPRAARRRAGEKMRLRKDDRLTVKGASLLVNDRPFKMTHPEDPPFAVRNGCLLTIVFRGCGYAMSEWDPEEIEGDYC
jgi:hypothetical protein